MGHGDASPLRRMSSGAICTKHFASPIPHAYLEHMTRAETAIVGAPVSVPTSKEITLPVKLISAWIELMTPSFWEPAPRA